MWNSSKRLHSAAGGDLKRSALGRRWVDYALAGLIGGLLISLAVNFILTLFAMYP